MSVNNTNPSSFFGGTWTSWGIGRVPVGVDTSQTEFKTVEKTGGEKTHTLTRKELPNERLKVLDGRYLPDSEVEVASFSDPGDNWPGLQLNSENYIGNGKKVVTETMGSGYSHNNLQPYITCYMWKRTA